MKLNKKKLEVVSLVDEEGYTYRELSYMYNVSYATIHSWYDTAKDLYYKMINEKDNLDHIIHLDITPKIYHILARSDIYSINTLISMIEDNSIMKIRGMGKVILSDILYAISSYKYKSTISVLYSTAYKNKRILKLNINTLNISTYGIFEYDINLKEKKLYLEVEDENMIKIKNKIIKEVEDIIDKDPSLGILDIKSTE